MSRKYNNNKLLMNGFNYVWIWKMNDKIWLQLILLLFFIYLLCSMEKKCLRWWKSLYNFTIRTSPMTILTMNIILILLWDHVVYFQLSFTIIYSMMIVMDVLDVHLWHYNLLQANYPPSVFQQLDRKVHCTKLRHKKIPFHYII